MTRTEMGLPVVLALYIFSWEGAPATSAAARSVQPHSITAASCAESDVASAIGLANIGDTVFLPACPSTLPGGPNTWTSTLLGSSGITTGINLIGAGEGQTVIIDNVSRAGCKDNPPIKFNISTDVPVRVSNLTIQGYALDPGACSYHMEVVGYSHQIRIDHATFNNMTTTGIGLFGDPQGVVDHCTFNGTGVRGILVRMTNYLGDSGGFGNNSWAQPDSLGGSANVFAEDNTFNIPTGAPTNMGCEWGARCVFRHNYGSVVGSHGNDSTAGNRSVRHMEVYNNTFDDQGTQIAFTLNLRGGTVIYYNNSATPHAGGGSYATLVSLANYRDVDEWTPWGPSNNSYKGGCDGAGPFDNNINGVYDSGTHNGSSGVADVLTDTTKSWTPNQYVGFSLRNLTGGGQSAWGSTISANTATTITTRASTQGTSTHTWNSGDSYQILSVYPCIDQVGRGQGTYISGQSNTVPPTPTGWPNQAVDPAYGWSNTLNGSNSTAFGTGYTHIQANRDYYDWNFSFDGTSGVGVGLLSARPSTCTPLVGYWATDTSTLYQCSATNTWTTYYKPYTYPHPLTLGSGTAPNPPTALIVISVH